ncbi:MAG: hypothetical protein JRH03_06780, partial [Deltaproteobacteria bacterium]|nr:hypothetical protein [Deltaproteobacteria bacterium]
MRSTNYSRRRNDVRRANDTEGKCCEERRRHTRCKFMQTADNNKSILLVDDEADIREVLGIAL